jgi:hypothetical protein
MDHIPKTDRLFQILHGAGWSIGDTAVASEERISWLVFGTHCDHSIQAHGTYQEEAWKQTRRHTGEFGQSNHAAELTLPTL